MATLFVRFREERTAGSSKSSFRKVGTPSPCRWSIGGSSGPHLQFGRLGGAHYERDRECLVETAGFGAPSVCSGSLRRSTSRLPSLGHRGKTSFSPPQLGLVRSFGGNEGYIFLFYQMTPQTESGFILEILSIFSNK